MVAIFSTAYQYDAYQFILDAYRQIKTPGNDTLDPVEQQKPSAKPDKAQVDLLIQQQYQKAQLPPADDELSDGERLQMVEKAMQELEHAEDEYDREVAVMTLGELNGVEARQGIVTALHDESKLVVSQAIRQINKWPEPGERTEMLLIALQSHDDDILEQTLMSINVVEDKKLISRLKQLSKHTNPDIREAATMALKLAP